MPHFHLVLGLLAAVVAVVAATRGRTDVAAVAGLLAAVLLGGAWLSYRGRRHGTFLF